MRSPPEMVMRPSSWSSRSPISISDCMRLLGLPERLGYPVQLLNGAITSASVFSCLNGFAFEAFQVRVTARYKGATIRRSRRSTCCLFCHRDRVIEPGVGFQFMFLASGRTLPAIRFETDFLEAYQPMLYSGYCCNLPSPCQ